MKAFNWLLGILFPKFCKGCKAHLEHGFLCAKCTDSIPIHTALFCPVCRARRPEGKMVCHKGAGYLLGSATDYHTPIMQELIRGLKFHAQQEISATLGALLVRYAQVIPKVPITDATLIIPIPLSQERQRARGFNQAELIARHCAKAWQVPLANAILFRSGHRKPQTELKGKEARLMNVINCFEIKNVEALKGQRVILIDDVVTSGATIGEAVRVLKSAGARSVLALTVAKA